MINIYLKGIISFRDLAEKAEEYGDEDIVNFVRKIIINSGEDPNQYFTESRGVLSPDNVVQKHSVN